MTINPETAPTPTAVSYATATDDWSGLKLANSTNQPTRERLSVFRFTDPILVWEGGSYSLRLLEEPKVRIQPTTVRLSVEGWGVELNIGDAGHLPRYLIRRFLELRQKAQTGNLSESEINNWTTIVDSVDMSDFSLQEALPRYVEGRITEKNSSKVVVLWHDGREQMLEAKFIATFDIINTNEDFGAYVKFGENDRPLTIERVIPIVSEQATSAN